MRRRRSLWAGRLPRKGCLQLHGGVNTECGNTERCKHPFREHWPPPRCPSLQSLFLWPTIKVGLMWVALEARFSEQAADCRPALVEGRSVSRAEPWRPPAFLPRLPSHLSRLTFSLKSSLTFDWLRSDPSSFWTSKLFLSRSVSVYILDFSSNRVITLMGFDKLCSWKLREYI